MKLSIIMPMYNASEIKENIEEVSRIISEFQEDYEIILVDDGSKNNCISEAKKIKNKKLKVVGYSKNNGKGNAIKYGFNYAQGDYIAFLDTGGDLNPRVLKSYLEILENNKNIDIVIGSKRHPQSKVHYPLLRKIMSLTYQILNKIMFNLNIKDTQVGIKLFKRESLNKVIPLLVVKRFAFDLELLVVAEKYKFKIIEAPITLKYNFKSTINIKSVFQMLLDTLAIFYRLKILRWYNEKS